MFLPLFPLLMYPHSMYLTLADLANTLSPGILIYVIDNLVNVIVVGPYLEKNNQQ
jgi:hypothetical protein